MVYILVFFWNIFRLGMKEGFVGTPDILEDKETVEVSEYGCDRDELFQSLC